VEEIKKVLTAVRYNLSNIRHHQYLFGAAMIKVIQFKYCTWE
jgi:hypothetical protein